MSLSGFNDVHEARGSVGGLPAPILRVSFIVLHREADDTETTALEVVVAGISDEGLVFSHGR